MNKEDNPLNAPTSDSIRKGELSISELSDSGATFIFWSDNREAIIDVAWIGYDGTQSEINRQVGNQNKVILPVSKAILKQWVGKKLYAQCNGTLGEGHYTSPPTHFMVVD
ncbi:hypothetical protein ACIP8I_21095 [Pseudomonas sp. NPDC088414]|uniref:hypothetical protein n=1 Tax=Pseudomonas sp. NPDC088414 TaxID=3364454 RepID=UPI003806BCBB